MNQIWFSIKETGQSLTNEIERAKVILDNYHKDPSYYEFSSLAKWAEHTVQIIE